MKLKRNSLFVRWCFIGEDLTPWQTSICALFWRGFVGKPLIAGVLGTLAASLLIAIYKALFEYTYITFTVLCAIASLVMLVMALRLLFTKTPARRGVEVVAEFYHARKEKWCPVVELEERD